MTMSKEQVSTFINEELTPMVKVSKPTAIGTLCEDFEALEIALASGNTTLVFAMASYISQCDGLLNGAEVAQRITAKVFG